MHKNSCRTIIFIFSLVGFCAAAWAEDEGQLSCLLEPSEEINIASQVQGVVKSVNAERGDSVRKGQVLVTLESGLEHATLRLAREKAEFSKRKASRNQDLIDKNILTAKEADEILTDQKIAELEINKANAILQQKIIYSPVNAVVIERLVSKGEYAGVEPLLKLAVLNPLHAQVVMQAGYYGMIKKNMKVEVIPEGKKGTVYTGRVKIVDRIIDAASNTFGVIIEIPNPDYKLPAGLKCRTHYMESQLEQHKQVLKN